MKEHALLALVSVCCIRAQAAVASGNYGAKWNGLGAVDDILARKALAPMNKRVLMAVLLAKVPRKAREPAYELLMVTGLFLALETMRHGHGLPASLALAAMLPLTFRYDYWDWIPELGAAAAVTSGNLALSLPWVLALGASKETWPLMPLAWACYGFGLPHGLALLGAGCLTASAAYVWQGPKPLYCDRVQAERNGRDLAWLIGQRQVLLRSDMTATLALTTVTLLACAHLGLRALPWLALLGAGWTLAIAVETRVLAACLVPVAIWLAGK